MKEKQAVGRRAPLTWRPSELVEQLLADEAEKTGRPKGQILNEILASVLGSPDRLARLASFGKVTPNAMAEIMRRSAHAANLSAASAIPGEPGSSGATTPQTRRAVRRAVRRASNARRLVKN